MRKINFCTLILMSAVIAATACASPLPNDAIPWDQLDGQTIIVGDKAFYDFELIGNNGSIPADISEIFVSGLLNADTGSPGVQFFLSWHTEENQTIDLEFSYKVAVLPDFDEFFIVGTSTYLVGAYADDPGSLNLNEIVMDGPIPDTDLVGEMNLSKLAGDGDLNLEGNLNFAPTKDIYVNNHISLAGPAGIDSFVQYFNQIPEPATMGLLALGSVVILRRKKRKSTVSGSPPE